MDFHNNRTTFVLLFMGEIDLGIEACLIMADDEKRSHADWFAAMAKDPPPHTEPPSIEKSIRGYWDETGIYFYQGADFHGGPEVKKYAKRYQRPVRDLAKLPKGTPIYIGVKPGVEGERWEPLEKL